MLTRKDFRNALLEARDNCDGFDDLIDITLNGVKIGNFSMSAAHIGNTQRLERGRMIQRISDANNWYRRNGDADKQFRRANAKRLRFMRMHGIVRPLP